jgi:hypothetical protein
MAIAEVFRYDSALRADPVGGAVARALECAVADQVGA